MHVLQSKREDSEIRANGAGASAAEMARENGWRWRATAAVVALLVSVPPALAASERLDDANAHLVKAAALLRAAGYSGESSKAHSYRERAIRLIEKAEREIARSKKAGSAPGVRIVPPHGTSGTGLRLK